jgi:hypothetical protein
MSNSSDDKKNEGKKDYQFGGIKEFNLEEIENEVLNDSVYLDVFAGSDLRFKENIKPNHLGLAEINAINTFTYEYKTEEFPEQNFPEGRVSGVMAQELEGVAPMAVKEDSNGMKYVNYAQLAPMLIEAVKELSAKVEKQEELIKDLESRLK